jgi:hypothetical protein
LKYENQFPWWKNKTALERSGCTTFRGGEKNKKKAMMKRINLSDAR